MRNLSGPADGPDRKAVTLQKTGDEFLAAGALPTLHDRYGLSTDAP
jgi:hypothetical protein